MQNPAVSFIMRADLQKQVDLFKTKWEWHTREELFSKQKAADIRACLKEAIHKKYQ